MTYEATRRGPEGDEVGGLSMNVAKTKYIVRGDLVATPGTIMVLPLDD